MVKIIKIDVHTHTRTDICTHAEDDTANGVSSRIYDVRRGVCIEYKLRAWIFDLNIWIGGSDDLILPILGWLTFIVKTIFSFKQK